SRNDIMASTDKVEFVVEVECGEAKNAGTYWAEVTGLTEDSNVNYRPKADKKRIQFTIAKATISANKITEPEVKTGLVYSVSAQELISAGSVSDNLGTFKYALAASENTAEESLNYTDSIPTGTNAGTYYVWYKVSANNAANYNEIAAKKVSVSIDKASISVSYNANEGEGTKASEVFKIGTASDNITVSTNSFTKAGHEFVSWNTAADGSGTGYAEGDTFAPEKIEDITLYAQWKAVTHTVSFNMNGYGDPIDPVVVISGNTVDEPATPSANGVVFDGWYAEAECTEEYDFEAPVVEDITLFAKWLQKYTVSFNMNGYGEPIDPVEVVSGDKVTRPATPSANGVVFGGWFTEAECTNEYDFNKTVSDNFTLFAKWTQKFTVSFNMGGHGAQIPSQEVLSGNTATRPADPNDPEYTFEDWFTAEDYANVYDFATPVSANTTVYAKWNLTVSLNSISINKAPAKTEYVEGEIFDPTGMEVSANYTDGSSKTVSGYTITPSANLTASDNKITVSYTEDGITCTADVAIKVKAEKAADVIVEDEEYSIWNLYEDNTEHTFVVEGASGNAVKNSNSKSSAYYDAELNGDTITVKAKGDLKKAVKTANTILEFVTDDGVVEFTLPVEYKKPALKLSVTNVTVKNGAKTTVKTTILRKSPAGVFEPMDLTGAEVKFAGKTAEILENGEIAFEEVTGAAKGKISVVCEGWVSSDPVELGFTIKGSGKDVINVEMNGIKTVIVNSNAKGQSFEFPVLFNGSDEELDKITVEDKKGTGLAKIEGGNLVIAYPEEGTVKKGNYTITLKGGSAKAVKVKVKVSETALTNAVKLSVKSKYDVVTGQKMVIVPAFKDLGGKLEDVSIEKEGFSAVVNEAGNIVVDYEGSAYNTRNLKMGDLTFKLTVEGVEDEVAVTVKKVSAKKTAVKVKAAKVFVKNGAGVANLVCSYKDSAGNMHLIAPEKINLDKLKNVTAVVDEEDPTAVNITSLNGKSGSVKANVQFRNGYSKTVTIKVGSK
ncbi:MAG: InlB B-repeat-containing protein, partial [Lachnospiraceae bacterium]|nr:InlB B-repeat-containing protein [Lachnospiraceae bacterium]